MREEWRIIDGTDGLYAVSSLGRIERQEKPSMRKNGTFRTDKARILHQYADHGGYLFVRLSVKGIAQRHFVHRLVCKEFIGDGGDKEVNHKNMDRKDNRLDNLEWVTRRENNTHKSKKFLTGAYRHGGCSTFFSKIKVGERIVNLGRYKTEIEAHNAYLKALEKYGIENRYAGK